MNHVENTLVKTAGEPGLGRLAHLQGRRELLGAGPAPWLSARRLGPVAARPHRAGLSGVRRGSCEGLLLFTSPHESGYPLG